MNTPQHDVITAFLDNEPFDAQALADVLATDDGRALLIDFVALRQVVQPDDRLLTLPQRGRVGGPVLWIAAAASIAVAAIGGYQIGAKRDVAIASPPPTPTVVIKADAWKEIWNELDDDDEDHKTLGRCASDGMAIDGVWAGTRSA